MNPADVLLIACLALVLIGVVYALVSWRAGYGTGHVLEGVGLAALSVGLYFAGLMQLAYDLLAALVAWWRDLVWTTQVQAGIAVLVGAVVLWIIAGALNRRGVGVMSKEDRKSRGEERRKARAERKTAKATTEVAAKPASPAAATRPGATSAPTGATAKGKQASGDEFDEIEDILRKRGIN